MPQNSDNKKPYVILYGDHGRIEDGQNITYSPGDKILLTPAEAKHFEGKIAPFNEASSVAKKVESPPIDVDLEQSKLIEPGVEPDEEVDWSFIVEKHWASVIRLIDDISNIDHLIAIREVEESRDSPRPSVLEAVDLRIESL